jgi:hypothetical protein
MARSQSRSAAAPIRAPETLRVAISLRVSTEEQRG